PARRCSAPCATTWRTTAGRLLARRSLETSSTRSSTGRRHRHSPESNQENTWDTPPIWLIEDGELPTIEVAMALRAESATHNATRGRCGDEPAPRARIAAR